MAAITAAAVTTAGTIYASNRASKNAKQASKDAKEMAAAADPYAAYRPEAAARLNELMNNPESIQDSAVWKARQMAAARAIAAQGYTGSGNAIVAAADAGASAYQQEFENLAMLSGAGEGLGYATQARTAGAGLAADARDTYMSSIGGVVNNLGNLATTIGGRFNQPARTGGG